MAKRDIVVIGASAGGVEALRDLVGALPAGLRASLFVTLHFPPTAPSVLARILSREGTLPAERVITRAPIVHGRVYVASPDFHLLVKPGVVESVRGPRENGHRPAIDPLFRSAARAYGRRVIGVVLTGSLDDGTLGLQQVKAHGGVALVQSPGEAPYPSMPRSAIENVAVDHVGTLTEIAELLVRLVREEVPEPEGTPRPDDVQDERDANEVDGGARANAAHGGAPSAYSCPECDGVLWELPEGAMSRFRCRVGHSYTETALLADQGHTLDAALWTALTALEEGAAMAGRAARRAARGGRSLAAERFGTQAQMLESRARIIRDVLQGLPTPHVGELEA